MSKTVIALTLLLVMTTVKADLSFSSFNGDFSSFDPASTGLSVSDLVTVANHYGCKTWVKNQCTECSQGWYFNKKGVCCEVPSLCSQFNRAEGICQACYQGYTIVDNCCKLAEQDLGCAEWNGNVCRRCSKRWWQDVNGVCQPIGDQCSTWSEQTGECLTCYGGYILSNGRCIVNPNPFNGGSNALCGKWDGQSCLSCAARSYFDSFGICAPVSDQCQTWDPIDGSCFTCYAGYSLNGGVCTKSPILPPTDVGCKTWNAAQDICLACSNRFYFNGNMCMPVSDQCRDWNTAGQCTACYNGYDLINGVCQFSSTNDMKPTDPGCGTWDWKNQKCLACSDNWVFNNMGVCVPVSDQCKTFNPSGACVSCYDGYRLNNGVCELAPIEKPSDEGCGTWDWKNRRCLACSDNWVFNNMGVCVPVSDQCKTFNPSGACVSCYKGYNLNNGACVLAPIEKPSDLGCALWNWDQKICLECSKHWVKNSQGVCTPVSDHCKMFNLAGQCTDCYDGYRLNNGVCELAPIEKPSDLGCGTWDWKNQKCLRCSNNWVFNGFGVCIPVSDQCKTFNSFGDCVSCYKGYNLEAGKCVLAPIEKVTDIGCAKWNWDQKICLECSVRHVFNSARMCVPVNDNCKAWDSTGACTDCYAGYLLQGGSCTQGNSLCEASNANGACTSCYTGYLLDNGSCVPISKLASLALFYSQCCPEKLATLTNSMGGGAGGHVQFHA